MATEWQPQLTPLHQLIECLDASLSARNRAAQKNAEIMLKQAKASLEIDNYLCFLLCHAGHALELSINQESLHIARSAAGIMLKNNVRTHFNSIPPTSVDYIRANIIGGIRDPNVQIRNFAGNVITELVKQANVKAWPEILPTLSSMACNDNGDVTIQAQEGAMGALLKICEDNKRALARTDNSERHLDYLIPRLIQCTSSANSKVRANAVASLTVFMEEKTEPLIHRLDAIFRRIFDLANDGSDEVKKRICSAICSLARIAPTKIAPHMENLVSYILAQQRDAREPDLALEAAEFWLIIGESSDLRDAVEPFLPSVIPVLLQCMIYSEDDVLRLEYEVEDAEREDRLQDIRPQFATPRAARVVTHSSANISVHNGDTFNDVELSEGELEEEAEDGDTYDYPEDQWNLRKCSAAALDVFASAFHGPVFHVTLPYLKIGLTHQDWPNREAAVLATGAIADGCMEAIEPHLPDLIPFLITLLNDEEPVVRKITSWSLGRYSGWASHLDTSGKERFFVPMMDGILKRMLDSDKRVQEAAASAFATLEEKSERELENPKYCGVIVRQFAECFSRYKDRNMFILYDCVQTLAEGVGPLLQNPELTQHLMPALMKRWNKLSDMSQEIFPLMECLSYVSTALGNTFSPYAPEVFARCIRVLHQSLEGGIEASGSPYMGESLADSMVSSLDLVSAIVQALDGQQISSLFNTTQPSLFGLLSRCLEDGNSSVKQSAFALLGDCAMNAFTDLLPNLQAILPIIVSHLNVSNPSQETIESGYPVANNACWSCGEISVRAGDGVLMYGETLLSAFFAILCNDSLPTSLHENAAIALGRLGIPCSDILSQHLSTIGPVLLRSLQPVAWTSEKVQAMTGLAQVVLKNPQGLEQCLLEFLNEISTAPAWYAKAGEGRIFQKILDLYKQSIADFSSLLRHLPHDNERSLRDNYQV